MFHLTFEKGRILQGLVYSLASFLRGITRMCWSRVFRIIQIESHHRFNLISSLLRHILQTFQLGHLGGACHAEEEASELRISSFFRISCDSIFPSVSMVIESLNTDDLSSCVDRYHELNSFTGSMSAQSYGSKFTFVSCLEDRSCIPMSGRRPIYLSAFQQLFRLCYIIPLSESDSLEYVIVITVYRDNAGKI